MQKDNTRSISVGKFDSSQTDASYDVIVIGSGISGLCCAALLAEKGRRVLALEKHFKVGGYTHTFKRQPYEWDVGLHYIGEVHKKETPARKLFDRITDGTLGWAKMDDNYDRIIFPDRTYDFYSPRERLVEDLKSWFPQEILAIDRYMDLIDLVSKACKGYFMNKAMPKILGQILSPILARPFYRLSDLTTYQQISQLTGDERLLGVLTGQWGDYGLTPRKSSFVMAAAVIGHYLDGGNYPVGGSSQIAANIVNFIRKNGGDIFVSSGVDEVLIRRGKAVGVRLDSGEELPAPHIVSSTGVINTRYRLLKSYYDLDDRDLDLNRNLDFDRQLQKVTPTMGHLCLHIGLKGSAEELKLGTANRWIYPSYDHDQNVENFVRDQSCDLPVLFLSFGSAKDPLWSKHSPGISTMEAITLAHYQWFTKWEERPWRSRGEDYEALKEAYALRMLDKVYEQLPQLEGKVDFYELSTPLSTRDMAHYRHGELYGIEHTPQRFRQNWLRPQSPIKGLYLTGQDTVTTGVTGALFSGLITASVMLKRNLFQELNNS